MSGNSSRVGVPQPAFPFGKGAFTLASAVTDETYAAVADCLVRVRSLAPPDRLNAVVMICRAWTDDIAGFRSEATDAS